MKQQTLKQKKLKILISGGGTGGHIFPAISIANEIAKRHSNAEILFVGANDRMEMEKIPAAGYKIIGLPVAGFKRKLTFENFVVIFKLIKSLLKARKIIRTFKPDVAIGVGGYASGPVLRIASKKGIPTLIQEQNSYAGVTNKLLSNKASAICVAYENMEKFFPKDKIVLTGNPIRQDITQLPLSKDEAYNFFNIEATRKVVLILGGSLGARTINESIIKNLDAIANSKAVYIWQTGKIYYERAKQIADEKNLPNLTVFDFISRMDLAYLLADVVVSRAGAGTISELCVVGKPSILIPSPNVAEDHQTKNAMALVNKHAALMVTDAQAEEKLTTEVEKLLNDTKQREEIANNIKKMALPQAASTIVNVIDKILAERES